jgi:oligoribonuclease (3'-5' exoribonuclease)
MHTSSRPSHSIIEIEEFSMTDSNLDALQRAYKLAVEEWIAAIKHEEALASVHHSVAKLDRWERAHLREDEIRSKVLEAKKQYEEALREMQFGF